MEEENRQELDADVSVVWHLLLDKGKATESQLEDALEESQMMNRDRKSVV